MARLILSMVLSGLIGCSKGRGNSSSPEDRMGTDLGSSEVCSSDIYLCLISLFGIGAGLVGPFIALLGRAVRGNEPHHHLEVAVLDHCAGGLGPV